MYNNVIPALASYPSLSPVCCTLLVVFTASVTSPLADLPYPDPCYFRSWCLDRLASDITLPPRMLSKVDLWHDTAWLQLSGLSHDRSNLYATWMSKPSSLTIPGLSMDAAPLKTSDGTVWAFVANSRNSTECCCPES